MIKKIRSSLFAKVFLLTTLLLTCMSFFIYTVLAWYLPQTYTNELNAALDGQTQKFISELEKVQFASSGGLFDRFLQSGQVSYAQLYGDNGQEMVLPTAQNNTSGDTAETGYAASYDNSGPFVNNPPVLTSSYYFSFAGDSTRYMLTVWGEAAQAGVLRHSFLKIMPLLLITILLVSLGVSWLYSHIITKPVLKISRISKEMSALHLEWKIEEQRIDELGTLEKSLNTLSQKLSGALKELQNANRQLKIDMEHEKELEQAQLNFFSAASHELKTPITIIKGQLEGMLLGIGPYKDHKKYLTRTLETANTLEVMVQEILIISRLETPNGEFRTERFDCAALVRSHISEIEDFITEKELQMHLDIEPSIYIEGNKFLIEKVFSNLIGNAVQYSPQGADIHIILYEKPDCCYCSIENSGVHIPTDSLPKLFEAFYRVEKSRSRKSGGSGLGLYIVDKILGQHGSSCNVYNTQTGVKFSFAIQIKARAVIESDTCFHM